MAYSGDHFEPGAVFCHIRRRSPTAVWLDEMDRVSAIPPASGLAIPPALAVRPARVPAAESPGWDFPVDFPAGAPTVAQA